MLDSMIPAGPNRPRIGIPWRTSEEGLAATQPWQGKIRYYADAVERAGGEPVELALNDPQSLQTMLPTLDGFVLPGSPADVEPREYGSHNVGLSAPADPLREQTDRSILEHAFALKKPVLAICYGCQLLNVYLGGTLDPGPAHRNRHASPTSPKRPYAGAGRRSSSLCAIRAG